jgi:hypothetical protein
MVPVFKPLFFQVKPSLSRCNKAEQPENAETLGSAWSDIHYLG